MNYSQDAVWWYFHNSNVRNLLALLVAPSPICHTQEIPTRILLGDFGFQYLKDLDRTPDTLQNFLQQSAYQNRDDYLHALWQFWKQNAPHRPNFDVRIVYQDLFNEKDVFRLPENIPNNLHLISRGVVFFPSISTPKTAWTGTIISFNPESQSIYQPISPYDLAPLKFSQMPEKKPITGIAALMQQRPDGIWHETERVLIQ